MSSASRAGLNHDDEMSKMIVNACLALGGAARGSRRSVA